MPSYKLPLFKNVALNVIEKTKAFVFCAGKIILAISIVVYGFYGPGKNSITETIQFSKTENAGIPQEELDNKVAAQTGELLHWNHGKKIIEPAISPLGYDWKIGMNHWLFCCAVFG
jgi:ferrous iron transport protein B